MTTLSKNVRTIENMGLFDRVVRFLVGGSILGYLVLYHGMQYPAITFGWQLVLTAVAVYAIITAMMGWAPLYSILGIRSCNSTGRNQCGSLPYQIKALMGHAPKYCDSDSEHSLESCHEDPQERPHHKLWKVEQEPMIYPSDADLNAYVSGQERKEHVKQQSDRRRAA